MDASTTSPLESRAGHVALAPRKIPLALCVLFFLSGGSGLIYEVVWLRMLSRTLGSTVYATSTILAVFMAGLMLGSFLFGRLADRLRRPLLLYVLLEFGIGLTALLSLGLNSWPVPLYQAIYAWAGHTRAVLTLGQVLLAMAALLVPTTLMGATLPTLCAYGIRRTSSMGWVAGTLYALNTLGATVGVLLSGFVLIGSIGETRTILVGAAINGLVSLLALAMAQKDGNEPSPAPDFTAVLVSTPSAPPVPPVKDNSQAHLVRRTVLVCFAISGFVSLALEIIWSRLLTLYLGTSIYGFTAMLGVMLLGIGIGGWWGGRVERWKDPLTALARLQMGIAFFAALGLALFPLLDDQLQYPSPLLVVGPAALLMGIAFPVAVRCYTDYAAALGKRVGELYAWNTLGCILGSLAGGFVLVPWLGTGDAATMLTRLALVSAAALLVVGHRGLRGVRALDAGLLLLALASTFMVGDPFAKVVIRRCHLRGISVFSHVEEATATTTAAGRQGDRTSKRLLVNGYGMTVLLTGNKLMGHLPLWLADSPHSALVICMGMGTTLRSVSRHPDIDVTAVEIVPAVPGMMHFFHADASAVLAQPNVHVVVDDGRNYLLMHPRKFDVITIDPAPPLYSAGTVNLYSRQFFELCAKRLTPGGIICLWVPPGTTSEVMMIMRTYVDVFPFISVWRGPNFPGFYLVGSLRPVSDIVARVRKGFTNPTTVADLTEWGDSCATPESVLGLYVCDRDALLRFTRGSPLITDDTPYTEFPIWRANWLHPEKMDVLIAPKLANWLRTHPR